MGIPPGDCRRAGELFGMKTFLNEFIAYKKLGALSQIDENKLFICIGASSNELVFHSFM